MHENYLYLPIVSTIVGAIVITRAESGVVLLQLPVLSLVRSLNRSCQRAFHNLQTLLQSLQDLFYTTAVRLGLSSELLWQCL